MTLYHLLAKLTRR